jgi:hypothetical protein
MAEPPSSFVFIVNSAKPASSEDAASGHAELYRPAKMSRTPLGAAVVQGSVIASVAMRLRMGSLGALAKNPLTHVGRALQQFNAVIFAPHQEMNHRDVDKGDLG